MKKNSTVATRRKDIFREKKLTIGMDLGALTGTSTKDTRASRASPYRRDVRCREFLPGDEPVHLQYLSESTPEKRRYRNEAQPLSEGKKPLSEKSTQYDRRRVPNIKGRPC